MKNGVLWCGVLLLAGCSGEKTAVASQRDAPRRATRNGAEARVVPSSADEILHEFQGLLQAPDGSTRWVILKIATAEPRDGGFIIHYTMNTMTGHVRRDSGTTVVDRSGTFTIQHVTSHFARGSDGLLVVESSALAGPPFWRLVQTKGKV